MIVIIEMSSVAYQDISFSNKAINSLIESRNILQLPILVLIMLSSKLGIKTLSNLTTEESLLISVCHS